MSVSDGGKTMGWGMRETHFEAVKLEGRWKEVYGVSKERGETGEGVLRGMGMTVCINVKMTWRRRSSVRLAT